jgi:hypothetical protein
MEAASGCFGAGRRTAYHRELQEQRGLGENNSEWERRERERD